MRLDKLTTKFQEALAEAQTLALGNDHAYIEPEHLLVAMLRQEDGPRSLLQRAGVNVPGLLAAAEAAAHQRTPGTGPREGAPGRGGQRARPAGRGRSRRAQAPAGAGPGAGAGRPGAGGPAAGR